MTPDQRRANARLAWVLVSVVCVFLAGFVVKIVILGG